MEDDGEPELITADAVADAPPLNKTRNLKPLGGRRRLMAFFIVLLGLWTFVAPTISTDPPVLSRAVWSPREILTEIHAGTLPVRHYENEPWWMDSVTIYFAAVYFLLSLALLTITLFPSPKLFMGIPFGVSSLPAGGKKAGSPPALNLCSTIRRIWFAMFISVNIR
jgi:hypothetical protein